MTDVVAAILLDKMNGPDMMNLDKLKADGYAIEYWFNVYSTGHGFKYSSSLACIDAANYGLRKPLYRIHVRLK